MLRQKVKYYLYFKLIFSLMFLGECPRFDIFRRQIENFETFVLFFQNFRKNEN
jgi:hypothetical protein